MVLVLLGLNLPQLHSSYPQGLGITRVKLLSSDLVKHSKENPVREVRKLLLTSSTYQVVTFR